MCISLLSGSIEIPFIGDFIDFKSWRKNRGCGIILKFLNSILINLFLLFFIFLDFFKICDPSETISCIIWKTYIKETRILRSSKLMHIVLWRFYQKELRSRDNCIVSNLCFDYPFRFKDFLILIRGEIIISVFFFNLIETLKIQFPKHQLKEYAHIRMIMEEHLLAFLYKEKYKSVIIWTLNNYSV